MIVGIAVVANVWWFSGRDGELRIPRLEQGMTGVTRQVMMTMTDRVVFVFVQSFV